MTADVDAENALRTAVLEFMDTVRGVEKAIAAERRGEDVPAELDVAPVGAITEEEWRACWPPAVEAPTGSRAAGELGSRTTRLRSRRTGSPRRRLGRGRIDRRRREHRADAVMFDTPGEPVYGTG